MVTVLDNDTSSKMALLQRADPSSRFWRNLFCKLATLHKGVV